MLRDNLNDTIAAIATPIGEGGIGIVRISGKDALGVADKIFVSASGKKVASFKTYTTHYGWVVEKSKEKELNLEAFRPEELIDEVILTVMRAPRSYTKEDIVEINCHGGIVALRKVLDLALENGCRLASPGEFTKRAFLNGRIDLTQAEAVIEVIRAKTDTALNLGVAQLKGVFSKEINNIREELLNILASLEANIDFPDEALGALDLEGVKNVLMQVNSRITKLLTDSKTAKILREGIYVVICGKPNSGKSSLLNALLKEERSIVTNVAGTTRDTVEEIMDIKGIPVRIVDTAGILEPRDLIEKKAIQRSKKYIDLADLVIVLFDGSTKLSKEDDFLIKRLKNKKSIAVINKIDLKQKIERQKLEARFDSIIEISAKKIKNINLLEDAIANFVFSGKIHSHEPLMAGNTRHILAIKSVQKSVLEAIDSTQEKLSVEFIAQGAKDALIKLDEILGRQFHEGLLDKIFSEFCIGK